MTPLLAAGMQTFPARVPIGAGRYLGFEQTGLATTGTLFAATPGIFGAAIAVSNGYELLLIRVEADADGDGFGDESQDNCKGQNGPNARSGRGRSNRLGWPGEG